MVVTLSNAALVEYLVNSQDVESNDGLLFIESCNGLKIMRIQYNFEIEHIRQVLKSWYD